MKLSFCTIAYRNRRISLKEIIFKIAEWGYEAVEIWGYHLVRLSGLWEIKQALTITGLNVSVVSPYFNFTANAMEWKKSIKKAEEFIEYAYELKACGIRCFTGRVGSKIATSKQWEDGVTGIRTIADMAHRKGLEVFIETHPDTLADTTESTIRLLNAVGRDNVGIICDLYNLWEVEGDNLFDSFKILYPYIRHLHLKNANTDTRIKSPFSLVHVKDADLSTISYLDNGNVNYENYLNYLKKNNFSGYLSVEWFGDDVETAAQHEYHYLKSFIKRD